MAKMGVPVLKLKAGYGHGKHSGSARAVAMEALEERRSADEDLDEKKTKNNEYMPGGFTSGEKLCDYWEKQAAAYRVKLKNGSTRKLRSDANIGCAWILKPEKEYMDSLPAEKQRQLLYDARDITMQEFRKIGIQTDAWVIHNDEANPHMHLFGHDPDYKIGNTVDLKLFRVLNKSVPEQLRQRGWNIQDCCLYDAEKVKGMTPEEAAAYKNQCIEVKKKRNAGVSSATYKNRKRKEKLDEREKRVNSKDASVSAREAVVQKREVAVIRMEKEVSERERTAAAKLRKAEADTAEAVKAKREAAAETAKAAAVTKRYKAEVDTLQEQKARYNAVIAAYQTHPEDNDLVAFTKSIKYRNGKSIYDVFQQRHSARLERISRAERLERGSVDYQSPGDDYEKQGY